MEPHVSTDLGGMYNKPEEEWVVAESSGDDFVIISYFCVKTVTLAQDD